MDVASISYSTERMDVTFIFSPLYAEFSLVDNWSFAYCAEIMDVVSILFHCVQILLLSTSSFYIQCRKKEFIIQFLLAVFRFSSKSHPLFAWSAENSACGHKCFLRYMGVGIQGYANTYAAEEHLYPHPHFSFLDKV